MGKLIAFALDKTERNIYDKISEIVREAYISIDKKLDTNLSEMQIREFVIIPE